jgi:hypothetical protein
MRKIYRFLLLPFNEKRLLGRSFALIVLVRLGLWVIPFNVLDRWLNGVHLVRDKGVDWAIVKRVVRSVRYCSRYVPFASCLTQALVTRVLLRMEGQPSDLKIGVERDRNEKFGAHAWIEVDGRIVIGKLPEHHRFAILS